jgi:Uma2 family endonuclease
MSSVYESSFPPIVIHMAPSWRKMSGDDFFEFCQANPSLKLEMSSSGDVIIMTPSGSESGRRNATLIGKLFAWAENNGEGIVFDSQSGFELPNGAQRAPDCAWIRRERYEQLPIEKRRKFAPIAPDFVAELRSPSDRLSDPHAKMKEYMDNGVRVGWLIDPDTQTVWIYEQGKESQRLDHPAEVDGGSVLPGFALKLSTIW